MPPAQSIDEHCHRQYRVFMLRAGQNDMFLRRKRRISTCADYSGRTRQVLTEDQAGGGALCVHRPGAPARG